MEIGLLLASAEAGAAAKKPDPAGTPAAEPGFDKALSVQLARISDKGHAKSRGETPAESASAVAASQEPSGEAEGSREAEGAGEVERSGEGRRTARKHQVRSKSGTGAGDTSNPVERGERADPEDGVLRKQPVRLDAPVSIRTIEGELPVSGVSTVAPQERDPAQLTETVRTRLTGMERPSGPLADGFEPQRERTADPRAVVIGTAAMHPRGGEARASADAAAAEGEAGPTESRAEPESIRMETRTGPGLMPFGVRNEAPAEPMLNPIASLTPNGRGREAAADHGREMLESAVQTSGTTMDGRVRTVAGTTTPGSAQTASLSRMTELPEAPGVVRAGETKTPAGSAAEGASTVLAEAVAATDPRPTEMNAAVRSLDRLVPEFRGKLERVLQRMQNEFGLEVHVTETWRAQERQDQLFSQGRTTPGPVVTWTRNSNHTRGQAADVRFEGQTSQGAAFQQLARVAAEEGLRTLGPEDPGHIEMPGTGAGESRAPTPTSNPAASPIGVARLARVASPAAVAQVAGMGSATPASAVIEDGGEPKRSSRDHTAPRRAQRTLEALPESPREFRAVEDVRAATGRVIQAEPSRSRDTEPSASETPGFAAGLRGENLHGSAERAAVETPNQGSSSGPAQAAATQTRGPDIAERVARVLMLRDAAAAAPATGVTLTLDGADGAAARIRLALRGNTVGTTIDVTDPVDAMEMASRTGELQRVLEKHGLETGRLTIREALSGLTADTRVNTIDAANTWLRSSADHGRREPQDGPPAHWRDASTEDSRQQRRNAKEERK